MSVSYIIVKQERIPNFLGLPAAVAMIQSRGIEPLMQRSPQSSVEAVANSPEIVLQIFKYLSIQSKKQFRQVSKHFHNATLAYWRNNVEVRIEVSEALHLQPGNGSCGFTPYVSNRSLERFLQKCLSIGADGFYKIRDVPFKNFMIEYERISPEPLLNKNLNELSRKDKVWLYFWRAFGDHIDRLCLFYCEFGTSSGSPERLSVIKSILLQGCKNLKELVLISPAFFKRFSAENEAVVNKPYRGEAEGDGVANELVAVAGKLESLKITCLRELVGHKYVSGRFSESEAKGLLEIVPNLKSLTIESTTFQLISLLLSPLPNFSRRKNGSGGSGRSTSIKYIKLENLSLTFREDQSQTNLFEHLLAYMTTAKPCLKSFELVVSGRDHVLPRDPPYTFQKFLGACSKTLKKLKIIDATVPEDFSEEYYWFSELSGGKGFPQLTHLEIKFFDFVTQRSCMKFDFGSLKGMPKLRSFKCTGWGFNLGDISILGVEDGLIFSGVNNGNRVAVTYSGGVNTNSSSIKLNLKHLEEFHYDLKCRLDFDCLKKICIWIKNLKKLKLVLIDEDRDAVGKVFGMWKKLEILTLCEGSQIGEVYFNEEKSFCPVGTNKW